jgi:hypothetical protein
MPQFHQFFSPTPNGHRNSNQPLPVTSLPHRPKIVNFANTSVQENSAIRGSTLCVLPSNCVTFVVFLSDDSLNPPEAPPLAEINRKLVDLCEGFKDLIIFNFDNKPGRE